MELEEAIEIYNERAGNEEIRQFEEARSLIIEEMNSGEPELEFYKSSNRYDYYIEKPYNSLDFERNKVIETHHGYNAIGKNRIETLNFCLSLCGYSKEQIITEIENHIKADKMSTI